MDQVFADLHCLDRGQFLPLAVEASSLLIKHSHDQPVLEFRLKPEHPEETLKQLQGFLSKPKPELHFASAKQVFQGRLDSIDECFGSDAPEFIVRLRGRILPL